MSKKYEANLKVELISKELTKEELRVHLAKLTDEDFNGNNGEDYHIEVNGELMSRLDSFMCNYKPNCDLSTFINDVLTDNYSDGYYNDYKINMIELENNLVVSLSYI